MNTLAENAASGSTRGRRRLARAAGLALLIIALLGALLVWFNLRGEQGVHAYGHGGWSGARETPTALITPEKDAAAKEAEAKAKAAETEAAELQRKADEAKAKAEAARAAAK